MTLEEARLNLHACTLRPADAEAEARAFASSDPTLRTWLKFQTTLDEKIADVMDTAPVPSGLNERLLAAMMAEAAPPVAKPAWSAAVMSCLALAAVIAISGVTLWWNAQPAWQKEALALVKQIDSGSLPLDKQSAVIAELKVVLAKAKVPTPENLPSDLIALSTVGCKVIEIAGRPASVVCFHLAADQIAHLVTFKMTDIPQAPHAGEPEFSQEGDWHIATWSKESRATSWRPRQMPQNFAGCLPGYRASSGHAHLPEDARSQLQSRHSRDEMQPGLLFPELQIGSRAKLGCHSQPRHYPPPLMAKPALGKGLGALISAQPAVSGVARPPALAQPAPGDVVNRVTLDRIVPSPLQPRKEFVQEQLAELMVSIREHGIIQPLIVRPVNGKLELIAGERRFRASREIGLTEVPVIVREASDKDVLEMALIENLQREDLNPIEEARAYERLAKDFAMRQEDIAQRVGKNRATVANTMRLLDLATPVQQLLSMGKLSTGHAKVLLTLKDSAHQQLAAADIIKRDSLCVLRRSWQLAF